MTQLQEAQRLPHFDVADRMRKALRDADLGVQEMADYLGVKRNAVSAWINGRNACPPPALRLFAQRTNVSVDWLSHGPDFHDAALGNSSTADQKVRGSNPFGRAPWAPSHRDRRRRQRLHVVPLHLVRGDEAVPA